MLRMLLCLLLASLLKTGAAQTPQTEINEQVWKPFCQGLRNLDTTQYLSVHSIALIRAERSNQKVYTYDVYSQNTKNGFAGALANKTKSPDIRFHMELRFLQRVASAWVAYEVGYFKSMLSFPDGRQQVYYSQFHVSLRKEAGVWKILTDSSLPMPALTEEEFLKAQPLLQ